MALLMVGAGVAAFIQGAFHTSWMENSVPWTPENGVNAPVLLVISGMCCFFLANKHSHLNSVQYAVKFGAALLVVFSSLVLMQHVLGLEPWLDFVRPGVEPSVFNPYPGRMAPNTCVAFMASGLAIGLLCRRDRSSITWPLTISIWIVTLISFAAIAGYLLRLEGLYKIADLNKMLPATAAALGTLSVVLWIIRDTGVIVDQQSFDRQEILIARRSIAVLTLVSISAGIAGFAVLREMLDRTLSESVSLTASTNATSLTNSLETGLWFPRTIATRPSVQETLFKLNTNPRDLLTRDFLSKVGESFLTAGISGVEFFNAEKQLIDAIGSTVGEDAISKHQMTVTGQRANLLWLEGYILATENTVYFKDQIVGYVRTEQRLLVADKLLAAIRKSNESSDALICSRDGDEALCAPSRFYSTPTRIPMFKSPGVLNLPANFALAGESGVSAVKDLRGVDVVAAYLPLAPYGLAFVVKSDVNTLFAPLKERFQLLLLLLVGLVSAGTVALLMRVRPLLRQIVHEQRRMRVILDNSNDAFIAIDSNGRVTDWNAAAERTFGWSAQSALGQSLSKLIIPQSEREAHKEGFDNFLKTGQGAVINRRIEVVALHEKGHEVSIELAVAALHDGIGYTAHAFARDISERRAAEQKLAQSELRLRKITENVPALISQFDRDGRLIFANQHCAKVYGVEQDALIGKTVAEVRGEDGQRQLGPFIRRALAGEHVAFESTAILDGEVHCFQQSYVPDITDDGRCIGFYSVSFDVTGRKKTEQRVQDSERRLRDITDNLPVLISYIDAKMNLTFVNATFQDWMGIDPSDVVGKQVVDAIGVTLFEERRIYMEKAFAGQRVSFEAESEALGIRRNLQNEYIPDISQDGQVVGLYALSTDVTKLKAIEKQLNTLARNDYLTGLANRYEFNQRLPDAIARAERSGHSIALLFLDIDHFKAINDELGHATGDEVLREFGARLLRCVRITDSVARLAGDEFVIILESLHSEAEAELVAQKIIAKINLPFIVADLPLRVATSIGIAFHIHGSVTPADLLASADKALYEAKFGGRNQYRIIRSESTAREPD
jgi:diguanylate cyclase (GGDEF)-like protein/PAS domain S-box-containing protein